jgi:hypothetical protein
MFQHSNILVVVECIIIKAFWCLEIKVMTSPKHSSDMCSNVCVVSVAPAISNKTHGRRREIALAVEMEFVEKIRKSFRNVNGHDIWDNY